MLSEYIGHLCLNLALVLYLIHYFPQLIHNRKPANRKQINLHYHGLLTIAYLSDLIFAFGMKMPWQYCLVSVMGVICLLTQHFQLKNHYQQQRLFINYQSLIGISILLFFTSIFLKLPKPFFLAMGYVCQAAIWTYTIPQMWQNFINKQGKAINGIYLCMSLACYGLDIIASITLDWPYPAKIGAIFGFCCTVILIYQKWIYKKQIIMVEQMT